MISRRRFCIAGTLVAAAAVVASAPGAWAGQEAPLSYILGATAISEVFGSGLRLVAVAIRHDRPMDGTAIDPSLYSVDGRTVTRVYAATAPDPAAESDAGTFVIVELDPEDAAAALFVYGGQAARRLPAAATVTVEVEGAPVRAPGAGGPPDFNSLPRSIATDQEHALVVDSFRQGRFEDPETGDVLGYNLYLPDSPGPLPLVIFLHDAGNTSPVLDTTLIQGLGAVSWASPADQARHPAIVLAPQYASAVVDDASKATSMLETTLHLIEKVASEQGVDRNRIYATGQSGGGMLSIAMMIRAPELFAAGFQVACQWDPALVAPLARQRLWVMVSEGDLKAFPGQTAIMEVIEGQGTAVSRAAWDGRSDAETFAAAVAEQAGEGRAVNFTVLRKGTVVPEGQSDDPGANHVNTWRIAYDIPGIRDWIMDQVRKA